MANELRVSVVAKGAERLVVVDDLQNTGRLALYYNLPTGGRVLHDMWVREERVPWPTRLGWLFPSCNERARQANMLRDFAESALAGRESSWT